MGKKPSKFVAVNEFGWRIGQDHHNAKLSNDDIDHIRDLREDLGLSYSEIARRYSISVAGVQKICNYTRRSQSVDHFKKVNE